MRVYSFTLAANATAQINAQGTFIRCLTAAATFDMVAKKVDGTSLGDFVGFQAGLAVTCPGQFAVVDIANGVTAQTVAILIHDGPVDDNRLVGIVNITGGLDAKVLAPSTVTLAGSATIAVTNAATLVIAAGTKRGKLILQNTSANPIAIGFSNAVTFAAGIILEPVGAGANAGGSIELETNTAVYAVAGVAGPSVLRAIANEYV